MLFARRKQYFARKIHNFFFRRFQWYIMKATPHNPVPVMDYQQFHKMRRMVHSCCNYDGGNCLALDDGEACRCSKHFLFGTLQMVSAAILPTDKKLEAALYYRLGAKHCAACIALFLPGSNRAKFCPSCAANRK